MRSRFTTRPPAASVIAIIRPSTKSGTPATMCFGGVPMRGGQFSRTRSKLPPMPPDVTSTVGACSSKSPTTSRELGALRGTSDGASTDAAHAVDGSVGDGQLVDPVPEGEAQLAALGGLLRRARRTARRGPGPCPR